MNALGYTFLFKFIFSWVRDPFARYIQLQKSINLSLKRCTK